MRLVNKMTTLKMAILINGQGCHFDRFESASMKLIKDWAKDRGGCYTLVVDHALQFAVKNNRFYKIK